MIENMIRDRFNRWSRGKFADLVRGTKRPPYLTSEDLKSWKKEASSKSPWRFYFAEKLLDRLQDFVFLPYDIFNTFDAYWSNRFVTKTHVLKTGLKAGQYHELDDRILHGLFNELKEFVEVVKGVDKLLWETSLVHNEEEHFFPNDPEYGKPTPQAKSARKILRLYKWWMNRHDRRRADLKGVSSVRLLELNGLHEAEDEKMLIRLIKIRGCLWT